MTTGATTSWLAIDVGAESGRAIAGRFDGDRLVLDEVHRFRNTPVDGPDGPAWVRDVTFDEGRSQISTGAAAQATAACGNLAPGCRTFARRPGGAITLVAIAGFAMIKRPCLWPRSPCMELGDMVV